MKWARCPLGEPHLGGEVLFYFQRTTAGLSNRFDLGRRSTGHTFSFPDSPVFCYGSGEIISAAKAASSLTHAVAHFVVPPRRLVVPETSRQ